MAMVASAVEWRGALSVTRDALDGTVRVCDADGRQLLRVFYASWEECDFVVRLAEAANAYPRLKAAAGRAAALCHFVLSLPCPWWKVEPEDYEELRDRALSTLISFMQAEPERQEELRREYPNDMRRRERLDKALEACRLMLQSEELGIKAVQYRYAGMETEYEQLWLESAAVERQALSAAKEALEMPVGRDGDA